MIIYAILYGLTLIETFTVLAVLQLLRMPVVLLPLAITQLYLVTVLKKCISLFLIFTDISFHVKSFNVIHLI